MAKNEQGLGTIRTVRDRVTKEPIGFEALLPRELSKPAPPTCKNPKLYQRQVGPRFSTWQAARTHLTAAINERLDPATIKHGLPLAHYVAGAVKAAHGKALAKYKAASRASARVSTWRSVDKLWLARAPFYEWTPAQITIEMLQDWIDSLATVNSATTGKPLGPSSIGSVVQLLSAAFKAAKILPNPMRSVTKPEPGPSGMRFLDLPEQQRLFRSRRIAIRDRLIAGCGMGAALRIGELLSLEVTDLFLDCEHPHLRVRYGGPHHSPPKGDDGKDETEIREVQLFEPGLGFFRLWMRDHYQGGARVFAGPSGGYLYDWPRLFPPTEEGAPAGPASFSDVVGKEIVSHAMRHSYAVSMLSGSWGYEPQSLEFVQEQLRHADKSTTERYYKNYAKGAMAKQVAHFTGRKARPKKPKPVTAAELLGVTAHDASFDASPIKSLAKTDFLENHAHLPISAQVPGKTGSSEASTHQALTALAREVLRAVEAGEPADYIRSMAGEIARLAGSVTLTEAAGQ